MSKNMRMIISPASNERGQALLGLALAMLLIGLVIGWGGGFLRPPVAGEQRDLALRDLDEVRRALHIYAAVNSSTLPEPDAGEMLPYLALGVKPTDAWGRSFKYVVDPAMTVTRNQTCSTLQVLRAGPPWPPGYPAVEIWDAASGISGMRTPAAAVLISAGPKDADHEGDPFDADGPWSNITGPYLKAETTDSFDDVAVYLPPDSFYDWLKSQYRAPLDPLAVFDWTSCTAQHCADGFVNYDETSTDHGGSDCPP